MLPRQFRITERRVLGCGEVKRYTREAEAKATGAQYKRGTPSMRRAVTIQRPEARRSSLGQSEVQPKVGWRLERILQSKCSPDLRLVAKNQSSLAIAGSSRNIPQDSPVGAWRPG
jgi:hypothetical protein